MNATEGKGFLHRRFIRKIEPEDTRVAYLSASLEEGGGYTISLDVDRAYPEGKLYFYDRLIKFLGENREVALKEIEELETGQ